ncbi:snoRNA-splicing protein PRP40 ASCRUDRAFT_29371, partial [Ascoidea rubescens DSM 1968]
MDSLEWKDLKDPQGRTYYYNTITRATSWTKPQSSSLGPVVPNVVSYDDSIIDQALVDSNWKKYLSAQNNNKPYYYNKVTKVTTWEFPEEGNNGNVFVKKENDQITTENNNHILETSGIEKKENKVTKERDFQAELLNLFKDKNELLNISSSIVYNDDGKTKYTLMLRENKVDATWSFKQIMEKFINDKRYWIIDNSLDRQRLFHEYLINRTEEELMAENNSKEKFNKAFLNMLNNYKEEGKIFYYSRWKTIKRLIQDEPIYLHSIISEKEKKTCFDNFISELRNEQSKAKNELKKQAISELKDYFKVNLVKRDIINIKNNWKFVLNYIESDARFKENKNFKILTQLDLLNTYEEIFKEIQMEFENKIKKIDKINYRKDRIARDNFKNQILKKYSSGDNMIDVNTKFKDFHLLIKDEPAFIELCGRNGSTPLELFLDVVEEKTVNLRAQKDIVFNLLLEKNFKLINKNTLRFNMVNIKEYFLKLISENEKTKNIKEKDIGLIYEILINEEISDVFKIKKNVINR